MSKNTSILTKMMHKVRDENDADITEPTPKTKNYETKLYYFTAGAVSMIGAYAVGYLSAVINEKTSSKNK